MFKILSNISQIFCSPHPQATCLKTLLLGKYTFTYFLKLPITILMTFETCYFGVIPLLLRTQLTMTKHLLVTYEQTMRNAKMQ